MKEGENMLGEHITWLTLKYCPCTKLLEISDILIESKKNAGVADPVRLFENFHHELYSFIIS